LGLSPAAAPLANDSIAGSEVQSNLLITPVGMVVGCQDDPGAETGRLRRGMGAHELPQLLHLF
jgi:hypothetical protein